MSRFRSTKNEIPLEPISFKAPPELKRAVQELADTEERSVSSVLVRLLRDNPKIKEIQKKQMASIA